MATSLATPAPAVSAPAPSAPAPAAAPASTPSSAPISTYADPQATPVQIEREMDALLDGEAPPVDDVETDDVPAAVAAPPAPEGDDTAPPAADAEPEAPPVEAAAAPPVDPNAQPTTLPEGVKLRTVDGKKAWLVDPAVGQTAFAKAELANKAETILGEPLTEAALQFRQNVVEGFEGMRADMLSDNPADQARVIQHFAQVMSNAKEHGQLNHDAMSSLVRVTIDEALNGDPQTSASVLDHIVQSTIDRAVIGDNPALLTKITTQPRIVQGVIEGAYTKALTEPNQEVAKHLWSSAQQLEKANFNTYRPTKELEYLRSAGAKTLPVYDRGNGTQPAAPAPAAQPKAAAPANTGAQPDGNANAFKEWSNNANTAIHADGVITPVDASLSSISKEQREKYPESYNNLRNRLVNVVQEGLQKDETLRTQVDATKKRARVAATPEARNQLTKEITRRYAAATERILRENKGPLLTEFAQLVQAKSTAEATRLNNGRRVGTQAQPSGGPSTSRQVFKPPTTGTFAGAGAFEKELESALN